MSKQKKKGTARETKVVGLLREHGLDAERAPNNAPSKDVNLRVGSMRFAIEVKDRQALPLHQTLAGVQEHWEDEIPAVVWHRTHKPDGGRARPVGPTLIALRLDDFARLVAAIGDEDGKLEDEGEMS